MDWIPLIASTLRLVDQHDSDRAYGSPSNFTLESRSGHADGVYLDIAFHVIHWLKLLGQSANQGYLPFSAIQFTPDERGGPGRSHPYAAVTGKTGQTGMQNACPGQDGKARWLLGQCQNRRGEPGIRIR